MARRRALPGMTALAGVGAGFLGLWPRGRTATAGRATSLSAPHTDPEWRSCHTPSAYDALRRQGTEVSLSSKLVFATPAGACASALPLFASQTRCDNDTGRPGCWQPLPPAVAERDITRFEMDCPEVHCVKCGGYPGHGFPDGPPAAGLRYCTNGVVRPFDTA